MTPSADLEHLRARMTPGEQTRAIIQEVAERNDLTLAQIMSRTRKRHISWPRQEAMYEVAKRRTWMSLPDIGRVFGGMDHTNILHGIRQHCSRIGVSYPDFSARRRAAYWLQPVAFASYAEAMRKHSVAPPPPRPVVYAPEMPK